MTPWQIGISVLILFLCGLLAGYIAGKQMGARRLKDRVRAAAALEMRQKLLQRGVCPTCDRSTQDMVQYRTKG